MRTPKTESFREQALREAAEFSKGWTWDRFLLHWRDRLDDFAVVVDPIFREISVRDPSNPWERKPALSWWPTKDFEVLRENIHRHFERFPGTIGPVHPDTTNVLKGELETLEHLWSVRDEPNKVAAVLF